MAVALRKPSIVGNLVSVDNAPVDAALKSDFGKYITGMKKVEAAGVRKQSEADEILQAYEEVRNTHCIKANTHHPEFTDPSIPPIESHTNLR